LVSPRDLGARQKVNVILKYSTWGIDGNARTKQAYLLSTIIVVKSSMRQLLLSNIKLSMQIMCQLHKMDALSYYTGTKLKIYGFCPIHGTFSLIVA
jgi:hypothetical protein